MRGACRLPAMSGHKYDRLNIRDDLRDDLRDDQFDRAEAATSIAIALFAMTAPTQERLLA